MAATEETKATPFRHRGCGGIVAVSLDGEFCCRCSAELQPGDWSDLQEPNLLLMSGWSPSPGEPGYDPPDSYGGR